MSETETTAPTVQQAWANVMGDVRALDKGDRNQQQGFNFRGVDAVMNAVGPALRRHGVSVVPVAVSSLVASTYTTKSGTSMRDVTLLATYAITGPAGDSMPGGAAGEASDAGDKAVPKAMSVAYRTFLLQALCLPTQDTDPDAETYDRAPEPTHAELTDMAQGAADKMPATTDAAVLHRVQSWAQDRGLLALTVTDDQGAPSSLGDLFARHIERVAA